LLYAHACADARVTTRQLAQRPSAHAKGPSEHIVVLRPLQS